LVVDSAAAAIPKRIAAGLGQRKELPTNIREALEKVNRGNTTDSVEYKAASAGFLNRHVPHVANGSASGYDEVSARG